MQGLKARKKSSDSNSVRLNNVGLFIFQAASSGKPETLESAFNTIPQHEGESKPLSLLTPCWSQNASDLLIDTDLNQLQCKEV